MRGWPSGLSLRACPAVLPGTVLRVGEFELTDIRDGHAAAFATWKVSLNDKTLGAGLAAAQHAKSRQVCIPIGICLPVAVGACSLAMACWVSLVRGMAVPE